MRFEKKDDVVFGVGLKGGGLFWCGSEGIGCASLDGGRDSCGF